MKVDRRPGSGVAKIHIEDDGSYFQVSQVSSSPADLSSDRCSDHGTFHVSPALSQVCTAEGSLQRWQFRHPSLSSSNCVTFFSPDHLFLVKPTSCVIEQCQDPGPTALKLTPRLSAIWVLENTHAVPRTAGTTGRTGPGVPPQQARSHRMARGRARQREPAIPGKESMFTQPWRATWQPSWGPA